MMRVSVKMSVRYLLFVVNIVNLSSSEFVVVNTWAFTAANRKAHSVLASGGSAVDAVVEGCSQCELDQCDGTVGFGGSPDENGETTLDALIIDGPTHDMGAVSGLRRIKSAIKVAREVLRRTEHTLLTGDSATSFAKSMGFKEESLTTVTSHMKFVRWRDNNCQPNFWRNVLPDPRVSCGPYSPLKPARKSFFSRKSIAIDSGNHDTIGMVGMDSSGNMAAGTSTNGANHKIAGRVGDSPVPGAGAYLDNQFGGATATGDGDIMMRFLPTFHAVELMRAGLGPEESCRESLKRIINVYPSFSGAIVALNKSGFHGGACHGFPNFPYSASSEGSNSTDVINVACT